MTYFYLKVHFGTISTGEKYLRGVWENWYLPSLCPPTPPWWPWWQRTSGCFESSQWLIWFFHSSPRLLALPRQSYLMLGFCLRLASSCILCTTLRFTFLLGYTQPGLNMLFSPYVIPAQLSTKPRSAPCPRHTSSFNPAQGFVVTSHCVSNYTYIAL